MCTLSFRSPRSLHHRSCFLCTFDNEHELPLQFRISRHPDTTQQFGIPHLADTLLPSTHTLSSDKTCKGGGRSRRSRAMTRSLRGVGNLLQQQKAGGMWTTTLPPTAPRLGSKAVYDNPRDPVDGKPFLSLQLIMITLPSNTRWFLAYQPAICKPHLSNHSKPSAFIGPRSSPRFCEEFVVHKPLKHPLLES